MSDISPAEVAIQQESVQFNQPVSESSLASIGALANFLLDVQFPIGSILNSMLTPAQFAANYASYGQRWVIADGSSAAGTAYQTMTGNGNLPDFRGCFIRGNDNPSGSNARGIGPTSLGVFENDITRSHTHVAFGRSGLNGGDGGYFFGTAAGPQAGSNLTQINVANTGGTQTQPKNTTANVYIRVN